MKKLFSSIAAILIIAISHVQYSYQDINRQRVNKTIMEARVQRILKNPADRDLTATTTGIKPCIAS